MNQASHFLDGSVIYGSTDKKMKSLRSMWGGRLITTLQKNGEEYPPIVNSSDIPCRLTNISDCFIAGWYYSTSWEPINKIKTQLNNYAKEVYLSIIQRKHC